MKILGKLIKAISTLHIMPGDTLQLTYEDPDGVKHIVLDRELTESYNIDKVAAFEFEDASEFEMGRGFGGAFGESDG